MMWLVFQSFTDVESVRVMVCSEILSGALMFVLLLKSTAINFGGHRGLDTTGFNWKT